MIKRIFKTSVFSIASRFFITSTNLSIIYFITKNLNERELGIYGIAFFFFQFFSSFSSMGMHIYIGKEVASLRENNKQIINIFKEFLKASLYGILSSAILIIISLIFYKKLSIELLIISFIAGFLLGFEKNLGGFLLGKELMGREAIINSVEFIIVFLSLFFVFKSIFISVISIFILRIIALLFGIVLRIISLRDMISFKLSNLKFRVFKEVKFYWFSTISYLFFRQVDVFILSFYFSKSIIGEYFLSIRIFLAIGILSEVVSLALTPFISRVFNNKEKISLSRFRNIIFSLSLIIGVLLGFLLFVLKDFFISIFNKSMIENCSPYLSILAIAIPFRFSIYILGAFMSSSKYQNIRLYINIAGSIIFVISVLVLIIPFSVMGAIYSKILTEVFLFISYFYFVFFKLKQNNE